MFLGDDEDERTYRLAEQVAASQHIQECVSLELQWSWGIHVCAILRISQYEGYEIKSEVSSPLYFIRSEYHHIVGPIPKFYTKPDLVWLANPSFLLREELIEILYNEHEKGWSTLIDLFLEEKWAQIDTYLI